MRDKYYKIIIRTPSEFKTEEYKKDEIVDGEIERLAGRRISGLWDTQAWLISWKAAHIENHRLVPDTEYARYIIKSLASEPKWIKTNIFRARDRFRIPKS